jgi:hypothetical protein
VQDISPNPGLSSHQQGIMFPCLDTSRIALCTQSTVIRDLLRRDNTRTVCSAHTAYCVSRMVLTTNSDGFPVHHKQSVLQCSCNAFPMNYEFGSYLSFATDTIVKGLQFIVGSRHVERI